MRPLPRAWTWGWRPCRLRGWSRLAAVRPGGQRYQIHTVRRLHHAAQRGPSDLQCAGAYLQMRTTARAFPRRASASDAALLPRALRRGRGHRSLLGHRGRDRLCAQRHTAAGSRVHEHGCSCGASQRNDCMARRSARKRILIFSSHQILNHPGTLKRIIIKYADTYTAAKSKQHTTNTTVFLQKSSAGTTEVATNIQR